MISLWKHRRRLVIGAALLLAMGSPAIRAVGPSVDLTPEHLVEVGLHLPSYMTTIRGIMDFQDKLTYHQELRLEWDSLPGRTGIIKASEVEGLPIAPNFTLIDRKQRIPGGAGKSNWAVGDSLIIAAITSKNQVRGLKIEHDPRKMHSEDFSTPTPKRHDFIVPKGTIFLALPDDPQIVAIVFFIPAKGGSDGGWRLREVGRLALPSR